MHASAKSMAEHINHMRSGTPSTPKNPSLAIANANTTMPGADVPCPIEPAIFPTVSKLTTKFAKLKFKSLGEGRLGGELLAKFPRQMAQIYHPIVTKFLYTVTPPIQWTGGVLCDLLKPGGAPTKAAGYREITVCDADARLALSLLRSTASPFLDASSPAGQWWMPFGVHCLCASALPRFH